MKKGIFFLGFIFILTFLYKKTQKYDQPKNVTPADNPLLAHSEKQYANNSRATQQSVTESASSNSSVINDEEDSGPDSFIDFIANPLGAELQNNTVKVKPEVGEDYKKIFPTDGMGHEREEGFGVVNDSVQDIVAFLRSKIATRGGDAILTQEKRSKSLFFKILNGKSFNGSVIFEDGSRNPSVSLRISSGGNDIIHVETDGKILEHRSIPVTSEGIWRLDLLKDGLLIFQTRCPYNPSYDYEKKQLYYFTKSQKLGAIIYCNRIQEADYVWHPIGFVTANMN
ncbi:MAG: hypothetical protein WCK43_04725 [bacterium]